MTTSHDALMHAMKAFDQLSNFKHKKHRPQDGAAIQTASEIIEAVVEENGYKIFYNGMKPSLIPLAEYHKKKLP